MIQFAIALAAFILIHVGLSGTPLRRTAIKAIGEGPYRGLFSLASAGLLAWMLFSYGAARTDPGNALLWTAPDWGRHVTATLVLVGFLIGVTGLLTPSPTAVGFESTLQKPEPAKGILRVTRHPFLWGVTLWGLGHLAANPETTSVMLFGGLAVMALLGTRSIDRKTAARDPAAWAAFRNATSNIPFGAIIQGRNRLRILEIAPRALAALAIFAAAAWFHRYIAGVPAFGFGA